MPEVHKTHWLYFRGRYHELGIPAVSPAARHVARHLDVLVRASLLFGPFGVLVQVPCEQHLTRTELSDATRGDYLWLHSGTALLAAGDSLSLPAPLSRTLDDCTWMHDGWLDGRSMCQSGLLTRDAYRTQAQGVQADMRHRHIPARACRHACLPAHATDLPATREARANTR